MNPIMIDDEFKKLIPALDDDEMRQLEENIIRDGCRDPLVIWDETNILLDGHHRHAICLKNARHFNVVRLSFTDRLAAREWVWTNQLGRRNLSTEMISYIRGNLYATRKQRHGGDRKSRPQNGAMIDGRTREQLAKETGVSKNTIERDEAFAAAVDTIAETAGDDARRLILSGESGLSKERIKQIAIEAPSTIQFQMEVSAQKHELTEETLGADEIGEANKATRAVRDSRVLKVLDQVDKLMRSFGQFSGFVLKFRGDEPVSEVFGDWKKKQASWLYQEVDEIVGEMRTWQIAMEERFPELRRDRRKLTAVR